LVAWLGAHGFATNALLTLDTDGNGRSRVQEFAFNFGPGDQPESRDPIMTAVGDEVYVTMTCRTDIANTLESNPSLASDLLIDASGSMITVTSTDLGGSENVRFEFNPILGAREFSRIRLSHF
jgi:hypothetical protein